MKAKTQRKTLTTVFPLRLLKDVQLSVRLANHEVCKILPGQTKTVSTYGIVFIKYLSALVFYEKQIFFFGVKIIRRDFIKNLLKQSLRPCNIFSNC